MTAPLSISLASLAARTTSGSGDAFDLYDDDDLARAIARISVRVAAVDTPGTGLVLTLQTSPDGTNWITLTRLDAIYEACTLELTLPGLLQHLRVTWTVPDGASFTFSVACVAHQVYCEPADVARFAAKDCSIKNADDAAKADACIAATDLAAGYVGAATTLPISTWGEDLRMRTAQIVAAILVARLIENPVGPDAIVFEERNAAIAWLERLADGKIALPSVTDETPEVFDGGAVVVSNTSRGWGR